jgi:hypothetical protein
MLLYFFAIFGAILVITDMLSWIGFLFQNLYKIPVDDRKVSLLGDITGGVIGGGGTMLAVILSIHKTDEVQLEHQQEIRTQQKIDFSNEIIKLVAKYNTDICGYFFGIKRQLTLQQKLDEARGENDSNKEQRIELELEKLNVNRTIAIECWYTLHMKLDNYAPAKNLLKQLDHIHNDLSMDKDVESQGFQMAVDCLSRLTIDFCQLYTK